jgi:hypothetical protein
MRPRWLQDPVLMVGAFSAAAGFVIGCCGYGTWQVAVESAQVVAGLVHYPRDNPFYVYHTKLWTVLHPLAALLLRAGLTEGTVSLLVSGLLGAVSFPALALTALAVGRDRLIALGVPFFVELTRAANFEIAYPIWILGSTHTYGVLGLSAALLAVALVGNGRYGAGAFALGVLPCVHPSVGVWTWLVVGLAIASGGRGLRETLRPALRPFLIGVGLTLVSFAGHKLFISDVPPADAATSSRYLSAFVRTWDTHRSAVPLRNPGVYVAVGALAVCVLALLRMRALLTPAARLLLRILIVSAILGLGFLVLSRVPDRLPDTLLILMPNRLVNLIVLAACPLLIGLLAARQDVLGSLNLAALVVAGAYLAEKVGVGYMKPNTNFHPAFPFVLWPAITPALGLGLSAALLALALLLRRQEASPASRANVIMIGLRLVSLGAMTWAVMVAADRTQSQWPARHDVLRDFRGDALLAQVAEQKGLLITASDLHLVQLRTRRPVLIDGGGLDLLAYTLEAGPVLDKILRRVYGIDLFNPPPEAHRLGMIPPLTTQAKWASRGPEEWVAIGQEFGATGVLTPPDWRLHLPLVARNDQFAFYRIGP